jgi:hypothetical protein
MSSLYYAYFKPPYSVKNLINSIAIQAIRNTYKLHFKSEKCIEKSRTRSHSIGEFETDFG